MSRAPNGMIRCKKCRGVFHKRNTTSRLCKRCKEDARAPHGYIRCIKCRTIHPRNEVTNRKCSNCHSKPRPKKDHRFCKGCKIETLKTAMMEDFCSYCSALKSTCRCGCDEEMPYYTVRGTIRQYKNKKHVGKSKAGAKPEKLCRACRTITPRDELVNYLCLRCNSLTSTCKCGCGETISYYTNYRADIRQYKDRSHLAIALWNNPKYRHIKIESMTGEKHPNWKGGIAHEPYDERFTPEFKELVRKRQNYHCLDKDETCSNDRKALSVHHVDENKKNSILENCVALCHSHHMRAHHNKEKREQYEVFLSACIDNVVTNKISNRPIQVDDCF